MYSLTNDLEQIVKALREASISFEIVGGVAVNAHIFPTHRSHSFVTGEIDILIHRSDHERAAAALTRQGHELAEAVDLLFVGEKSKSTQPLPHPDLHPEEKDFLGIAIPVAPLRDLLQMKLSSFRPKDLVHLEILDEAGLITPALEGELPVELRVRLKEARKRIAEDQPDIEG